MFHALVKALHARVSRTMGQPVIDCTLRDALPSIALRLDEQDFAFAGEDLLDYVIRMDNTELVREFGLKKGQTACVLALQGGDSGFDGRMIVSDCATNTLPSLIGV